MYQVKVDVGLLNNVIIIDLTFRALALRQSKRDVQTDNELHQVKGDVGMLNTVKIY